MGFQRFASVYRWGLGKGTKYSLGPKGWQYSAAISRKSRFLSSCRWGTPIGKHSTTEARRMRHSFRSGVNECNGDLSTVDLDHYNVPKCLQRLLFTTKRQP